MTGPDTAADAFLALLAARGVEYLFANGGTDFSPVAEARAKGQAHGTRMPQPVIVPHENLGMAMMHGYTMVTGRAQAMMVHVGVGTANALNGFINASRQNIPMLLCAGRSPLTESALLTGARNNYIHWAQEHFDQGAMLREFAKWDYELKHASQVQAAVDRALAIAQSEPQGPVYLTLPREVLASSLAGQPLSAAPLQVPASPPAADPEILDAVAKLVARAQRPLLITANGGRTPGGARAIARLAEEFAIGVVQYRPRYMALSTEHPMHLGWEPHASLKEADLVLVVDCDVPWIPRLGGPRDEAKVVHIGPDPLFSRYPMRGFRTDLALTGRVAPTLEQLCERIGLRAPAAASLASRREARKAQSAAQRTRGRSGGAPLSAQWASASLNAALDEDAVVVNEYPLVLEEMTIREPGRYFGTPPSGGLGWGLGAALGAKLASPGRTVVCALGDGSYMFGNPTPGHYVSAAMGLPVLFVVFNNARWAAVHRATLADYPDGYAAKSASPPFAELEPAPRFEHVVRASGGHGERVSAPEQMRPALERALRIVREEKRQALVDICIAASYVKTS
ncbi:MAG: thiamine pyrophosphate-requiring protein [Betaproteobacteria bacterium]|nr:thiamine pyrophosphate-requiring protein [Betaproteobacteria bacterium]